MVQDLNRAKTCHQSEKDDTIPKQRQNLSTVKTRWCNSQTELTYRQSEKRWYNTQTGPKPVTSQIKMVRYSNSAKT